MSLTRYLAKRISNYDRSESVGSRFRANRIGPLLDMVKRVHGEFGFVNIIDLGGTLNYWNIIDHEALTNDNVTVTIVNLPGSVLPENRGPFKFVEADGCDLSRYETNSFHIAHSNSVIEHVGDWERMVAFAGEIRRVSEKYFVQTPNYWFPIEPHCMTPFFQWLPKPLRIRLVMSYQLGHWRRASTTDEAVRTVESARLLNRQMMRWLFSDAEIRTERVLGLPKSFIAIKA